MTPAAAVIGERANTVADPAEARLDRDLGAAFGFTRIADPSDVAGVLTSYLDAAARGFDPAGHAVLALRGLLLALPHRAISASGDAALLQLERAFQGAAPTVAFHVDGRLPTEAVHLGMGAASGLVGVMRRPIGDLGESRELVRARIDHVALLADEIDAVIRRHRIEAAGDRFRRALRIANARCAVDDGRPLN